MIGRIPARPHSSGAGSIGGKPRLETAGSLLVRLDDLGADEVAKRVLRYIPTVCPNEQSKRPDYVVTDTRHSISLIYEVCSNPWPCTHLFGGSIVA